MFIRRDFARNGIVTRHLEQDLGGIKLIKVDASKDCNLDTECDVYRTEVPIPKTVRFNFTDAVTYVGDLTGLGSIPLVNSNIVKYLIHDKYTKNKPKAYMIEDYLYIYNPNGMGYVNVRGVFEDPEDVAKFDCDGTDCYTDDHQFPIPMDFLQAINIGILGGELQVLGSTASDTTNDRYQTVQGVPQVKMPDQGQQTE